MDNHLLHLTQRAAELLVAELSSPAEPVCVIDSSWPLAPRPKLSYWQRRGSKTDNNIWQQDYAAIMMGLPRARDELLMNIHLAAARLQPNAPLILYGLKSAGIESAATLLPELFRSFTTPLIKYHGRILVARHPHQNKLTSELIAWQKAQIVTIGERDIALISYPGMFAAGGLDKATALLIACLPQLFAPQHVLDYACGTGVLGLAAQQLWPEAALDFVDHDTLAIAATRINVPEARRVWQGEDMSLCQSRYDLIVSNPPIHHGTKQDYGVIERFVRAAPDYLTPNGNLMLVAQQTVPVQKWAKNTAILSEADGFRVWRLN